MNKIYVREDFRRDGLAANFLVTPKTIGLLGNSLPSSKINIGYPGICSEEYKSCENIILQNKDSPAELCITGHARQDHLEILLNLTKLNTNTSANIWIPVSDYFIKNTFNKDPEKIITHTENLIYKWTQKSSKPLDIALADITSNEPELIQRTKNWTKRLLEAGARNIILCDTRGISSPELTDKIFSELKKYKPHLEFHPHNDNGQALKNIKEAIKNGIKIIGTAVYCAGERKTMISPTQLRNLGLEIKDESYNLFLKSYADDIGNPEEVVDYIFGNKIIITGTQYRLRNRDQSLKPMFGVTSDRYILGRILNIDRESITENQLAHLKNELLYNQKNIVVSSEKIKEYINREEKNE